MVVPFEITEQASRPVSFIICIINASNSPAEMLQLSTQPVPTEANTRPEVQPLLFQLHFFESSEVQVLVAQSCPTLWDPKDYSLPDSSFHRVFWARILEWVAISFSGGSFQPRGWTWVSRIAGRFFPSEPPGKPLQFLTSGHKLFRFPWPSASCRLSNYLQWVSFIYFPDLLFSFNHFPPLYSLAFFSHSLHAFYVQI